jgi:hypothetical protein
LGIYEALYVASVTLDNRTQSCAKNTFDDKLEEDRYISVQR